MSKDSKFRVLLLGEPYVGCTSICYRLWDGTFMTNPPATIGLDFNSRTFKVGGQKARMQIWEPNRSERYLPVTISIMQDRKLTWDSIVLVYDVTKETSFGAIPKWIKYVQESINSENVEMMLLGNKCDLKDQRQISFERGQKLAIEQNINRFMEISTKSGLNVEEAFTLLANDLKAKMDMKLKQCECCLM